MNIGEGWAAVVRTTVAESGTVKVEGVHYWCPKMNRLAGREVFVRVPEREGAPAQVWIGDHYQCSPDVIADVGFGNSVSAKAAAAQARELRAEVQKDKALVVRRQAALLMELLEHPVQHRRFGVRATLFSLADAIKNRLVEGFVETGQNRAKRLGDGKIKVADGIDPRLQIAQRIFELGEFGLGGHIESPAGDVGDASHANDAAHRLSGGAK